MQGLQQSMRQAMRRPSLYTRLNGQARVRIHSMATSYSHKSLTCCECRLCSIMDALVLHKKILHRAILTEHPSLACTLPVTGA